MNTLGRGTTRPSDTPQSSPLGVHLWSSEMRLNLKQSKGMQIYAVPFTVWLVHSVIPPTLTSLCSVTPPTIEIIV